MSTKAWEKLDKFYVIFFSTLAVLAVLVIFTFRGLFSAFLTAYEVEQPDNSDIKINTDQLDEAYKYAFGKSDLAPTTGATISAEPSKAPTASPTVTTKQK